MRAGYAAARDGGEGPETLEHGSRFAVSAHGSGRGISRVCLKIAFRQMYVTVCGRFVPNEGRIAGYVT